jgi:small basic protein (TIGR04137 family)
MGRPVAAYKHLLGINMSIDKSLRRTNSLARARNVLTRGERIKVMTDLETWVDGKSPYGLPKTKVAKVVIKKTKKVKEEGAEEGAEGEAAAAPPAEKAKK